MLNRLVSGKPLALNGDASAEKAGASRKARAETFSIRRLEGD